MLLIVWQRWCMARPKGHQLNRDGFTAWLEIHLGTTTSAIAEVAGIPRATIANLANGNRGATPPVARRLANAMGCPVGLLFPTLGSSASRYGAPAVVAVDEDEAA